VLVDDHVHLTRLEVLEPRPEQLVVSSAFGIAPFGKDPPVHGTVQGRGLALFKRVELVEALDKE
jgi:hypothetical protein